MNNKLPGAQFRNIQILRRYNLLCSTALTVVSALVFTDQLMLRMGIDTRLFGSIKSMLFLLPAIAYQCMSPLLNRIKKPAQFCAWCYLFRCLIPSFLPLIALLTKNHTILTIACFLLPSIGMMLAGFANNTLMIVYRQVIPEHDFNRQVCIMNMLLSIPCSILALGAAKIFDMAADSSDNAFFLTFLILNLISFCFEIPAFIELNKIAIPQVEKKNVAKFSWEDMFKPYLDAKYRDLLIIIVWRAILNGFMAAYITIYMLQVRNYSITMITTLSIVLCLLGDCVSPVTGKITDRIGYAKMFLILSLACLPGFIMLVAGWVHGIFMLFIFAFLTWDMGSTFFGRILNQTAYAAASKLTNPDYSSYYVSSFSLCNNGGLFIGSILGSCFYTIFLNRAGQDNLHQVYQNFFIVCLVFMLVLIALCTFYWHRNRKRDKQ